MSLAKGRPHTIESLRREGFPVVPGDRYIPASWLHKKVPSLAQVRRRLSKIKGSLAETLSEIRDEE